MQTRTDNNTDGLIEFMHLYEELSAAARLQFHAVITRNMWAHYSSERTRHNLKLAINTTYTLLIRFTFELYGAKVGAGLLWAMFAGLAMFTLVNMLQSN